MALINGIQIAGDGFRRVWGNHHGLKEAYETLSKFFLNSSYICADSRDRMQLITIGSLQMFSIMSRKSPYLTNWQRSLLFCQPKTPISVPKNETTRPWEAKLLELVERIVPEGSQTFWRHCPLGRIWTSKEYVYSLPMSISTKEPANLPTIFSCRRAAATAAWSLWSKLAYLDDSKRRTKHIGGVKFQKGSFPFSRW